jgi:hypothetical protein
MNTSLVDIKKNIINDNNYHVITTTVRYPVDNQNISKMIIEHIKKRSDFKNFTCSFQHRTALGIITRTYLTLIDARIIKNLILSASIIPRSMHFYIYVEEFDITFVNCGEIYSFKRLDNQLENYSNESRKRNYNVSSNINNEDVKKRKIDYDADIFLSKTISNIEKTSSRTTSNDEKTSSRTSLNDEKTSSRTTSNDENKSNDEKTSNDENKSNDEKISNDEDNIIFKIISSNKFSKEEKLKIIEYFI